VKYFVAAHVVLFAADTGPHVICSVSLVFPRISDISLPFQCNSAREICTKNFLSVSSVAATDSVAAILCLEAQINLCTYFLYLGTADGGTVVKALRHKPGGRGFDST
jgi:hypothetical protein